MIQGALIPVLLIIGALILEGIARAGFDPEKLVLKAKLVRSWSMVAGSWKEDTLLNPILKTYFQGYDTLPLIKTYGQNERCLTASPTFDQPHAHDGQG